MNRRQFLLAIGAVTVAHQLPEAEAKLPVKILGEPLYKYSCERGKYICVEVEMKRSDIDLKEYVKNVGCTSPHEVTIDGHRYPAGTVRFDGGNVERKDDYYECVYKFSIDPNRFIEAAVIDMGTGISTVRRKAITGKFKGIPG